uniref:Uncharacterized protein n=1 Tax=Glossina austeni TaxID=7395 RepID=A0A1A9USB6_GLOAU
MSTSNKYYSYQENSGYKEDYTTNSWNTNTIYKGCNFESIILEGSCDHQQARPVALPITVQHIAADKHKRPKTINVTAPKLERSRLAVEKRHVKNTSIAKFHRRLICASLSVTKRSRYSIKYQAPIAPIIYVILGIPNSEENVYQNWGGTQILENPGFGIRD